MISSSTADLPAEDAGRRRPTPEAWELVLGSGVSLKALAADLAARAGAGAAVEVAIAGVSDMTAGYRLAAGRGGGSEISAGAAPDSRSVAFVVSAAATGLSPWSEAAWLALFDSLLHDTGAAGSGIPGGIFMFAVDGLAEASSPAPGDPLLRGTSLREALADLGVLAVVVLDFNGPPASIAIRAASRRAMSPRRVLDAARSAFDEVSIGYTEEAGADFYSAAGFADGSAALGPWLDAGVPAVAIGTTEPSGPGSAAVDLGAFALAFAGASGSVPAPPSWGGEDVNYLRYPLPSAMITLGDGTIIASTLVMAAVIAFAMATGLLRGRRRKASVLAVAREAMAALVLALAALAGARLFSAIFMALLRGHVGAAPVEGFLGPWFTVLSLAARFAGALCCYYAASGLAARLGLHGDHGRIDAVLASLCFLVVEALVAVAVFPPAAPFFVASVAFIAFSSGTAVTTGLGLLGAALLALPLADPRVLGRQASIVPMMLGAGWRGTIILAALSAPLGLWLGAASSPVSSLHRGRRTVPAWLVGALSCAATEAALRLASGTP